MNKITKALVRKNGGKLVPFKDLTRPYQYAIIRYMCLDGEAWAVPNEDFPIIIGESGLEKALKGQAKWIKKNVQFWIDKYGKRKFGVVSLPKKDCAEAYKAIAGVDFQAGGDKEHYNEKWPAIISSFADEFLEDGWHRFGVYMDSNMRKIPLVYYPK